MQVVVVFKTSAHGLFKAGESESNNVIVSDHFILVLMVLINLL